MSKEKKKNSSTKKNNTNTKNNEEKIKDTKVTKATKKETSTKEKKQDKEIKVIDSIEAEDYELDENLVEDIDEEEIEEEEINEEEIDEEEYDEDLEDDDEDLEIEEIIEEKVTKTKPKKEKKKKEEKNTEEKIKKIERIAKEKKVKTSPKKKNSEFLLFLDKNRHTIYGFIGGIILTSLIAIIIWPDRIAALKNGEEPIVKVGKETYTADELYENMKDYYSVSLLLDEIDNDLLTKMYPENEELLEEVNSNAEYYLNMYEQYYGYTEEQFLEQNGFSSYNAFLEYLKLDYRRNKYLDEYVETGLTDDEIQKYYDDNVFGDINTQHILVEVAAEGDEDSGKLSDEDAKKLAEEIITKLNDGTSWEKIQEKYKDKITYEDLGYQSWDASLEESFMTALTEMEDNTYSEEPVKTSYGYHVIYRIDQKEAPTLKEAKETIVENLITDKKAEDSNLLYKALISLREEKNIDFKDTVMKEKYDDYCAQYK